MVGDPRVLLYGVLEAPEVYDEGVAELLQDIVYCGRGLDELEDSELALLNRATVDFATAKRPKPPTPPAPRPVKKPIPQPRTLEAARPHPSSEPLEIPKTAPTFWWREAPKK